MPGKQNDYDVIIIGAGISGLVCGCYLAKAGIKTLIVEQNVLPGGYCTSFIRKKYLFDTAVHYIGGIRKGSLATVIKELNIKNEFKFSQMDPADKIILPGSMTYVRANPYDTINEFKKSFSDEKQSINKFFDFIMQKDILKIYRNVHGLTFDDVLDRFFKNKNLKASIGILLLGNMGLPLNKIAAFAAVVFFREFLLDPGYYPAGGMQCFANYLAKKFKYYGGEIIYSTKVEEIITKSNKAIGVVLQDEKKIKAKNIVASIDATQTFKKLLKQKTKEGRNIDKLIISNSVFAVYIGLKMNIKRTLNDTCNIWYSNTANLELYYKNLSKNINKKKICMAMLSFPARKDHFKEEKDAETMQIFTISTFENQKFWIKNKEEIKQKIIGLSEQIIANLNRYIDVIETATPVTYYKYTLNKKGAAFGWASTVEQMNTALLPQVTSIKNLSLAGHWSIMGAGQGGISTVALSGRKIANKIINEIQQEK